MSALLVHLVLTLAWVALTGSAAAPNFLFGLVLAYVVVAWLRPVPGCAAYARRVPAAVRLAALFVWELVLSTVRVTWDVLTPKDYRRPGIVAVPLDARTDVEIALLACLITLTPGSLSVDVSPERDRLYVHSMFVEDPEEIREQIKSGFERRVLELMR